ncbi:amidase domain-containing protein [Segniliparus rugosus]|nr:amidase domain-containing protein [Segniliparus rugosus]
MTAANDLRAAADKLERTADEIHDNGTKKVEENWADRLGEMAKNRLIEGTTELSAIALIDRGSATALDTLSHAVTTAQNELRSYVEFAKGKGLEVSDSGQVSIPANAPYGEHEQLVHYQEQAQRLINEAVEAATQADGLAKDALKDLDVDTAPPPGSDQSKANEFINGIRAHQADAVTKSVNQIRDLLPDGLPPEDVAKWWGSLSQAGQDMFKKACPVDLFDLPGVPQQVKDQLDDKSRGYSNIGALRYARDHAYDDSINHVPDSKCTDFVSNVLHYGGGLPFKDNGLGMFDDTDNWTLAPAAELHVPKIQEHAMTHTWAGAENNKQFWLHNGGQQLPVSQAMPGDVLYWNGRGGNEPEGTAFHAAFATAVLPDGEVLYTQHDADGYNRSLQDREHSYETQDVGGAEVVAVRPKCTW